MGWVSLCMCQPCVYCMVVFLLPAVSELVSRKEKSWVCRWFFQGTSQPFCCSLLNQSCFLVYFGVFVLWRTRWPALIPSRSNWCASMSLFFPVMCCMEIAQFLSGSYWKVKVPSCFFPFLMSFPSFSLPGFLIPGSFALWSITPPKSRWVARCLFSRPFSCWTSLPITSILRHACGWRSIWPPTPRYWLLCRTLR